MPKQRRQRQRKRTTINDPAQHQLQHNPQQRRWTWKSNPGNFQGGEEGSKSEEEQIKEVDLTKSPVKKEKYEDRRDNTSKGKEDGKEAASILNSGRFSKAPDAGK